MLDIIHIEKQAIKRVKNFLHKVSEEENIPNDQAKLVINCTGLELNVKLYDQNKYVKALELKMLVEYFGQEYDPSKTKAVMDYLEQLAQEQKAEVSSLNLILCENKGQLGTHVYQDNKYIKKITTLELFSQFYF